MQKLVFETPNPQVDLSIDIMGMNAEQAAEYTRQFRQRTSPRNINLGCGSEPANVDVEQVTRSVAELIAVKPNTQVDMGVVGRAEAARAFFYWRYATELAKKHIRQTRSEDEANRIINGDDRTEFCALRNEKMRWVMKARFDIDMDGNAPAQSVGTTTDASASTAEGTTTAKATAPAVKPATKRRRRK